MTKLSNNIFLSDGKLLTKGSKILVGCEESQVVTIELRKLGYEAYSCDLQDCSGGYPEWHLKMDVFEAIELYDWQNVHMDTVIDSVANIVDDLSNNGTKIIIATGRDGECLALTELWLEKNNIPYDEIFIRDKGDMRPDWVIKREMAEKICKNNYISCWIDDRLQVTRYLRNIGVKVLNVDYNNF